MEWGWLCHIGEAVIWYITKSFMTDLVTLKSFTYSNVSNVFTIGALEVIQA